MSDTETVDLDSVGLLDSDSIPNSNQSLNCFSCGESMSGVYCYACGNKNDNYRRSIWSLGAELFSSLTALEGRIWRSLRSLIFKPGQMAREFSDGKRQKWTSPIRLYLATSLLLFGYVALSGTQLIAFGPKAAENSVAQVEIGEMKLSPQIFFLERKKTIKSAISDEAILAFEDEFLNFTNDNSDKTLEELKAEKARAENEIEKMETQIANANNKYAKSGMSRALPPMRKRIETLDKKIEDYNNDKNAPEDDADSVTSETQDANNDDDNIQITDAVGRKMTLNNEGFREAALIGLRNPERINAPISRYLPRIMFVMMPFSMLMGAIFIRGKERAMLFDHLVHAAYIHAFSFLLLFVFILLVQLTSIKGLLWVYTAILLVYLPLSAKRMFGRGWFKTFLTSYGVGAIYTFIMMLILILLIGIGISNILEGVAVKS